MENIKVSLIIPCRNEIDFIEEIFRNIDNQDFPKEQREVLFVDGMSTDGTDKKIKDYAASHLNVYLIENEKKVVPTGMNLGIRQSRGRVIMRWDAHSAYPDNYISRLVDELDRLGADNVGALWVTEPSTDTKKARAIARALSHPFGVGNSYFRIGSDSVKEVDTVPFGCYKRDVFDRIGLYDERLVRNQDIELNKRLTAAGGKILLLPDIACTYYARDEFSKLWKNNSGNGEWTILVSYLKGDFSSLSLRHFIPLFFVFYLLSLPVLLWISKWFAVPGVLYLLLSLYFSVRIMVQETSFLTGIFSWVSFLVLHLSYGTGSILGILKILFKRLRL